MRARTASGSYIASGQESLCSSSGSLSSTRCHGTCTVGAGSAECRIRPCGPASASTRSISTDEKRVFSGTAITPSQAHAYTSSRYSASFGSSRAKRSPAAKPCRRSAAATLTQRPWSSPKVSRVAPEETAGRSGKYRAARPRAYVWIIARAPRVSSVDFGVGNAREISLSDCDGTLFRSVQVCGVDRTGEIRDEHPIGSHIQCNADAFHQVAKHDFLVQMAVDRRATYGVAARRIAPIRPVEYAPLEIEFQIDRLRQPLAQQLDVQPVRRCLAATHIYARAKATPLPGVIRTLLSPVHLVANRIDGDPDTPVRWIAARAFALARLDERLDLRAIEVGTHHAHALAVRPVELAALLLEMELLWRERAAFCNDDSTIAAVEIRAFDRAVILVRNAHVGPVDVARSRIDREAVGKPASGDECFRIRAIGVEREDAAAAQDEHEQAAA